MSRIQLLRVLVNKRLTAAADEIFEAIDKTIAGYEEEILISKREIQWQRRMLQAASATEVKTSTTSDQPQLAMSVWDEDFPCDQLQQQQQQQHNVHGDQAALEAPQTEKSQDVLPSSQEEVQLEELEEDDTIRFIFTPPSLPSTSAEQLEGDDGAPVGCSDPERDDSDEEWRGSQGPQGDDSDNEGKWIKSNNKRPCLPLAPKLHPGKKTKSRICCKVCGKGFHANVSLVNHMEVHPKDVCGVCGDQFENEESFKAHLKAHVKAEICSVCGKCFGSSGSLETHTRIHTGEKPFNCQECGKSFNCRHNLTRPARIHTGEKPYRCTLCGKCFNDYSTLKRHSMVHVHKKNLKPSNASVVRSDICESREKKLKTLSAKKQQTRTTCEVCGKMFHSVVSLVNHAKSHSADLCGVCGKHFDSEDKLKLHLKTHKKGKICEVCGKCFDSQGSLEMHTRVHTGERPFLCNQCGKSFNCRHNMMRHIRTHTGEKPYVCDACGRCFGDHTSLKQHSSTHTGEKPHRCEVCGKAFHRKTYVRLHMKSHSKKK